MRPTSLRRLLMLQWSGFVLVLLLALGAFAVVALYVLEDSFIDRRLLDAERALAESRQPRAPVLLLRIDDLPVERHRELAQLPAGALREFRLTDGRYLHLRALQADASGPRFLAIDAQDELRVGPQLRESAPTLLGLLTLVVLLAIGLARRFVRRIESAMAALLPAIDAEGDSDSLRLAAAKQPVQEFRRFGTALADALDARLDALQREADTLRFLAHELRTPLQSARLAFASLPQTAGSEAAHARLQRSLQRLDRASAAVLWLSEHAPAIDPNEVASPARALAAELAPLAAQRGQRIECEVIDSLYWRLPTPAIESVLGNLVLNAIQHGAPGTVRLTIGGQELRVDNPRDPLAAGSGFGLGLELARRLLARVDWMLDAAEEGDRFVARVSPAQRTH